MKKNLKAVTFFVLLTFSLHFFGGTANVLAQDVPNGAIDGINYINDNTVVLVVVAPNKGSAYVTGTFNSWGQTNMNKTPDGKKFWVQLDGLNAGQEYIYQYVVDGIRIADPYAEKILDPWNDQYISSSTYPGLISYNDTGKGIASVFQTAQASYQWQVQNFSAPPDHKLVIYELLIRDFTAEHSYKSVADSIQYLKKLGINAIELLPVNEFEGNSSWGYNPSFYLAPDKYYGPKNELKNLIDVAHQNGIAIIIDMVLNHAFDQNPMAQLYWDNSNSKPAWDNPWFNQDAPHCYSWGNDFNHDSQYTKDFVDRVTSHWLSEYKIDGFRFDFTKGMTQIGSGNCGSDYNSNRIGIIKRMADKIWDVKSDAYIILEHWTAESEESELANYGNGMLPWRRVDHPYKEAISGNDLDNQSFAGAQTDNWVTFMESHDEERIMRQCLDYGASNGGYNIKNLPTALDRVALGAAFLYTVPGPKMIWMFGEQGYDYSIDHNGRTGEKPLVWSQYMQDQNRVDLYNAFSELLKLRKDHPVFTEGYFSWDAIGATRQIKITHSTMDVVIIGNFGTSSMNISPDFPHTGTWYNYFSGQEYTYNSGAQYLLAAGQWELFTSVRIDDNDISTPTNLSANVSGNNVSLSWTDNASNETGYQVERSTTSGSGFSLLTTLSANATSYSDNGLSDGTYYYRVRATGANNTFSDYSNEASAQIGTPVGFDVHFKNTSNWSNVYIYLFDKNANAPLAGWTWPGTPMSQEGTSPWYKYTINESVDVGIVINNNAGQKTDDLFRTTNGWYDYSTNTWHNTCPGDCPGVDPVPVLSVNPAGGTYPNSIIVSLSATNGGDIYYTTNGDAPDDGSTPYTGDLTFTTTTNLKAIAYNTTGSSNVIDETYTISTTDVYDVHFKNTSNWNDVYIYLYNKATGGQLAGWNWPGQPMSQEQTSKWYVYTIDEAVEVGIVINNNNNGQQTGDLSRTIEGWYDYSNSTWYNTCPGDCPGETPDGITLHYNNNSTNWNNVTLYYWSTTPTSISTSWPGVQMTDPDSDGWYSYTLPGVECANVIFSNNGNSQTGDLNICGDGYYDGGWVSAPSGLKSAKVSENPFINITEDTHVPFPNPFISEFKLRLAERDVKVKVRISDLKGSIIYNNEVYTNDGNISLVPQIEKGVYILNLSTGNKTSTYRIIKR